jgi:putative DNA primase/helicase
MRPPVVGGVERGELAVANRRKDLDIGAILMCAINISELMCAVNNVQEQQIAAHFSDAGNAARFARHHRGRLLYCDGTGWLHYDGIRWRSIGVEITRFAKGTVSTIYQEAARHSDEEKREAIGRWALKSESEKYIRAMVSLAQCELQVRADKLDQNPWLLNCENGTLDLRTGDLREHDSADLITKLAPVCYDPDSRSPLWDSVIRRALPDEQVRTYFQKLTGYTLTGCTREDIFALIHGPTRSSKGTVQDAIATMLGDYAITAELDVLAQRNRAGGPRPELTRFRGARMVSIFETSNRMALSASLVKTLAGSDPITARGLYKEPITFKPEAKIWVATNYLPKVPADDDALWERIREIPFNVTIPEHERDSTVRSRLREPEHGAAILAWAVEGCLLWQSERLAQPDAVREAGRAYREQMDLLGRFIEECCILGPQLWTPTATLREEYVKWCREQGETPESGDALKNKLREVGCEPLKNSRRGGRGWKGIDIRSGDYEDFSNIRIQGRPLTGDAGDGGDGGDGWGRPDA